ncbi:MAG: LON peptidase substrate-binding domain-containing protein, partial [Clostridia bacterium]|nr:LON peptidase substrate-binding domain-containing protein [Clostridia bacterium]
MQQTVINAAEYPAMALRGLVAFPDMMLTLDVGRKKSVDALNFAMENNSPIYLVTQKDITVEHPQNEDLYKIGCVCRVRQILKMPDGSVKALVNGLYRARHASINTSGEHFKANVVRLDDQPL